MKTETKLLIASAIAFAGLLTAFVAVIPAGPTEQATSSAVALDVIQAARDQKARIAEARIAGMRPPLPVIHVYDADEDDDLCPSDKPCAGSPGYKGQK